MRGFGRKCLSLSRPLTIALRARRADGGVVAALSPRAGRGVKGGIVMLDKQKPPPPCGGSGLSQASIFGLERSYATAF